MKINYYVTIQRKHLLLMFSIPHKKKQNTHFFWNPLYPSQYHFTSNIQNSFLLRGINNLLLTSFNQFLIKNIYIWVREHSELVEKQIPIKMVQVKRLDESTAFRSVGRVRELNKGWWGTQRIVKVGSCYHPLATGRKIELLCRSCSHGEP